MNEDLSPRKSIDTGTFICPIGMGYTDLPENFRTMSYLSGQVHLIQRESQLEFLEIESQSQIDTMKAFQNYD